jgi:hypothetical protein
MRILKAVCGTILVAMLGSCGGGGGVVLDAIAFSILSPMSDSASNDARPLIRWSTVDGQTRFRVRLYRDAALTDLIESIGVTGATEARPSNDIPDGGDVHAVVDVLDETGTVLVTGPRQRFRVLLLPPGMPRFDLLRRDPVLSQPGYRLFNIMDPTPPTPAERVTFLVLVNEQGAIVWWRKATQGTFTDARVLPNGHMLHIFQNPVAKTQRAFETTWDGQQEFWSSRTDIKVHHEVSVGPGGKYLYLKYTHRTVGTQLWEGDGLEVVDPATGAVLWDWDIFDHLSTADFDPVDILVTGRSGSGQDWTHCNACVWDEARSMIWVSVRHLERVIGVDYPSGQVRVTLGQGGLGGNGLLSHQHSPELQQDGSLLVFDNGNRRNPLYSRVVQLLWNEPANTVAEVAEWRESPDYYAGAVGDCDRLPNGNILVVAGTIGRIFEVTPANENVWEFSCSDPRFWVYRAEHVAPSEIPPGVLPFG